MRKRMTAKWHDMAAQLRRRLHEPIVTVGTWRNQVLNGYYNYPAVPGNLRSLWVFRNQVAQPWWRVLRRRSQKARQRWVDFAPLIPPFLPVPTVRHPYPLERFYAKHPR